MSRLAGIKALHAPGEALIGSGRADGPNAAVCGIKKRGDSVGPFQPSRAEARSLCSVLLPRPGPVHLHLQNKDAEGEQASPQVELCTPHAPGSSRLMQASALAAAPSAAASAYNSSRRRRRRRGKRRKHIPSEYNSTETKTKKTYIQYIL